MAIDPARLRDAIHYCSKESPRVCLNRVIVDVDGESPSDGVYIDFPQLDQPSIPFCAVKCPNSWHWADRCPDKLLARAEGSAQP